MPYGKAPGSVGAGHGGDGAKQYFPGHFAVQEERHRRIQHLVNDENARVRAGVDWCPLGVRPA